MLDVVNKTPFEVALIPNIDKDGYEFATIVIKATFDIKHGKILTLSEQPMPVFMGAKYRGEPDTSSLIYETDTAIRKKNTDIVLNGQAYTRDGPKKTTYVGLRVGDLQKVIQVFGDRQWINKMGLWKISDLEPFEIMPLIYENAFGGSDHSDPHRILSDMRNPVGKGFSLKTDLRLPNLEDPNNLIVKRRDRPAPVGFGFIAAHWQSRQQYAGTYDEKWKKRQAPLLPEDFNEHFFNAAEPGLIANGYLQGGENVMVKNASREQDLEFCLPHHQLEIAIWIKGKRQETVPNLDTVIIEPDENRLQIVWRAAIPCFRCFLYIDRVRIREKK